MGYCTSINHTVLGQSLINKVFRTKVPFNYSYNKFTGQYFMDEKYDDHLTIVDWDYHDNESFKMIIKKNIEFTITDMIKTWNVDAEHSIDILIKINKHIPLSHVYDVAERRNGKSVGVHISNSRSPKIHKSYEHLNISEPVILHVYNRDYNYTGLLINNYEVNTAVNYRHNILELIL